MRVLRVIRKGAHLVFYPGRHAWHRNDDTNRERAEYSWVIRIMGVKSLDKRRMDELKVEVGVKESFKKKLA
jgi:hypothetical protein